MIVVPSPEISTSLLELFALYLNPLYFFEFVAEIFVPVVSFLVSASTYS